MVQPFDYTTTIGNPGGAFQQAYAQGLQLRAAQEAQAMARMEAQQKAAQQQDLRAAMTAFAAAKTCFIGRLVPNVPLAFRRGSRWQILSPRARKSG